MAAAGQTRIAVFGKGGIGKSTFSANLSAWLALNGRKVLHVGCDPKADSSAVLAPDGVRVRTVMEALALTDRENLENIVVNRGRLGIDCIEVGGPEPGVGCGGRGISWALDFLDTSGLLKTRSYDVVLFDVLGDVVCGGFAAPLRRGFADKVIIIASGEEMSLYAANNIARAVVRYAPNGVALSGLVINDRCPIGTSGVDGLSVEGFAERINTRILARLPFSAALEKVRLKRRTMMEAAPDDDWSVALAGVGETIAEGCPCEAVTPSPMDLDAFNEFAGHSCSRPAEPDSNRLPRQEHRECKQLTAIGPEAETSKPPPAPHVRGFRAGAAAMAKLSELLGKGTALETADSKDNGRIELSFGAGQRPRTSILLEPPSAGRGYIRTPSFNISYMAKEIDARIERLTKLVAERLAAVPLEQLHRMIREAADSRPLDRPVDPGKRNESWADNDRWRRFFADDQFQRNVFHLFKVDVPHVGIQHGDPECHYATPPISNASLSFLNYPWLSPVPLADDPYGKRAEPGTFYSTWMREMDVVLGGAQRLETLLGNVVSSLRDEELVLLHNTCTPIVAGDDTKSLLDRVQPVCKCPIMFLGAHEGENPFVSFLDKVRKGRGFRKRRANPRFVNVVGYPLYGDSDEALSLLEHAGARIHSRVFPQVHLSLFDEYLAAAVQVLYPDAWMAEIRDRLLGDLPIATIEPAPPYGPAATQRWAESIAGQVGISSAIAGVLDDALASIGSRWEALRKESADCSLGIVVDRDRARKLGDARLTFGIPLLPVLAEMGFGIEVLAFTGGGGNGKGRPGLLTGAGSGESDARWIEERVAELLPDGCPFSFDTFDSPETLAGRLEASRSQAFYSDYCFDHRLVNAGKAQFSLQAFEMGFPGAVRTTERLLRLCSLPFFQRYGDPRGTTVRSTRRRSFPHSADKGARPTAVAVASSGERDSPSSSTVGHGSPSASSMESATGCAASLESATLPCNFPYLIGVYLAVNAIPDSCLLVDGPDCIHYKAQHIHGSHDLMSTLLDCAGRDRIVSTEVGLATIVEDRTESLTRRIRELRARPECSMLLLTSMPMVTLTGIQYDLLLTRLRKEGVDRVITVPALSLTGDWLDGYGETLAALAREIPLPASSGHGAPSSKVAVVGYMMSRNELDCVADVREIERLLDAIGLDPVSIWLSGRGIEHLARVAEAGTIVSLPHGRKAASILAERTGARLVQTSIPLGLRGTVEWLETIGAATGRLPAASAVTSREPVEVASRVKWLVHRYMVGTRALFVGDPHYLVPMAEFLDAIGMDVVAMLGVGRKEHLDPIPPQVLAGGIPVAFQANPYELSKLLPKSPGARDVDLAIQPETFGLRGEPGMAKVPFGFATPGWHALHDSPSLGFRGAQCLLHRIAEKLMARFPQAS